jgi:5-(aminomethyl)-3-furanmethanol phosphate kinase
MTGHALRAGAEASSLPAKVGPIVVKLGGSVVRSPDLASWLDAIAAAPAPTVIVPGGGALADEVRDCQVKLGFGDAAAHRMALLAMDQLAWAVAGLRGGFQVGATEDELLNALEHDLVAVWAPYALIAERTDIEESWRITSDSLALWLARRLHARRCYLIKSIARIKQSHASAEQLARDGIVDEAFPAMLSESRVPAVLLCRGDQAGFVAALSGADPCGVAID